LSSATGKSRSVEPGSKPRAFVSAVTSELSKARELVARKLRAIGFDVDTEEDWLTLGGGLLENLERMVTRADVFVQLVGRFPGTMAEPTIAKLPGITFTQLELHYAREAKETNGLLPHIYVFFADPNLSNDPNAVPDPKAAEGQRSYSEQVRRSGLTYYTVSSDFSLIDKVTELDAPQRVIDAWFKDWKNREGPPLERPSYGSGRVGGFSLATLHYSNRWLPWQTRRDDEAALGRFLNGPSPFLWWVITGEGGVGKSRLAQEIMLRNENDSWVFGSLSPRDGWWDRNSWVPQGDVLIVSDYAASRRNWTDALARLRQKVLARDPAAKVRVRVLLLTRPDGFTSFLKGSAGDGPFTLVRSALFRDDARPDAVAAGDAVAASEQRLVLPSEALVLEPVATHLREALVRVLESIAETNPDVSLKILKEALPDENQKAYWDDLSKKTGKGRWLLLQIYGWLFSLKQGEVGVGGRRTDFEVAKDLEALLRAFLVREIRSNWPAHRGRERNADEEDTDRIITVLATATVQQGLSRKVFFDLPDVRNLPTKRQGILWRRCHGILGSDPSSDRLPAVEPDLAGEALVLQALSTLGWDTDAPGDGGFVPSFDDKTVLLGPEGIVEHSLQHSRDGLAHFLGLIGRDFIAHNVTVRLFDLACRAALFNRSFVPTDDLIAALFDYGWGDYDDEAKRPKEYAQLLFGLLEERTELQQYIYDSGLIPRYAKFLRETADAIRAKGDAVQDVLSAVLVMKLLAHEMYRKNEEGGPPLFDDALTTIAKVLSSSDKSLLGRAWLLPWYQIFLNDHHSNDLSKASDFPKPETPEFAEYQSHRQAALDTLPERLKTGQRKPTQQDLPLLLRAAHLWGHVGNQEGRVLASYLRKGGGQAANEDMQNHLRLGQQAYLRAALFRMAGYKTSFFPTGKIDSVAAEAFGVAVTAVLALSPDEGQWLREFVETDFVDGQREHFMNRSQALGDTAHQLVGAAKIHYETLAGLFNELRREEREALLEEGDKFLKAGRALWDSTKTVADAEGTRLIQYFIWVVEEELFSRMLSVAISGGADAVSEIQLNEELNRRLDEIQTKFKINYPDAEKKIRGAVEDFYAYLLRMLRTAN